MAPKRVGEMAEAAFMVKAVQLGFGVAKPWGDSERYDFILDSGSRLWRVQLKCTTRMNSGSYEIKPVHSTYGHATKTYTKREIDVLVVYVLPCDAWYVLPVEAFPLVRRMGFYPHRKPKSALWEKYRERWGWLRSGSKLRTGSRVHSRVGKQVGHSPALV